MSSGGYGVDLAGLHLAEHGIKSVLAELRHLGIHGEETSGRTLGNLAHDPATWGDEGLYAAVYAFTDRWRWGLRAMVGDAEGMVEKLADTRSTYEKAEADAKEFFSGVLKDMYKKFDRTAPGIFEQRQGGGTQP
ncbi:hypothetical protein D5S17_28945 [Pseudonocardiaceae bacterium YIM PH 21723]|nr:hypothetical protein D5S17_28945 [Pseudonocardiaceae bacterium YIM PH 21723]